MVIVLAPGPEQLCSGSQRPCAPLLPWTSWLSRLCVTWAFSGTELVPELQLGPIKLAASA